MRKFWLVGLVVAFVLAHAVCAVNITSGVVFEGDNSSVTVLSDMNLTGVVVNETDVLFINYSSIYYVSDLTTDTVLNSSPDGSVINQSWQDGNYTLHKNAYFVEYSDDEVVETQLVTWSIKYIKDLVDLSVNLTYNNTPYSTTRYLNNDFYLFNSTFVIPTINLNQTNITYWWNYSYSTVRSNTSYFNVSVHALNMDNCTTFENDAVNFSVWNEEVTSLGLNATVEVTFSMYGYNNSISKNFSFVEWANNSFMFCKGGYNSSVDAYFKYNTTGGLTKRYYLINQLLNDSIVEIFAYSVNDSTPYSDLRGTVRDRDTRDLYSDVYVKMLRYYTGENLWRTVEMDKTGDYGNLFLNIREEDTDYAFKFFDSDGRLLRTTDNLKFSCDSGVCDVTFLVSPYSEAGLVTDLMVVDSYDNVTKNLTIDFNDPTGNTQSLNLLVETINPAGRSLVCNQTVSASAGSFVCDLSSVEGSVIATVYQTYNPTVQVFTKLYDVLSTKFRDVVGSKEVTFWASGVVVTLMGFGMIIHPAVTIIVGVLGIVVFSSVGLLSAMNLAAISVLIVVALFVVFRVSK